MTNRPKRVLHVVGGMARGGVETWLMHALRTADPGRVQMDFLVHTAQACAYDAEIEARNCRILRAVAPRHAPAYARGISRLLREQGPYDAVHSHVHHFSGYLLWLAGRAGVPIRIAHSHSDTGREDLRAGWARRAYIRFTERSIRHHATHLVGASRAAGRALFGKAWDSDCRKRLLHCGIDLAPFRTAPDRQVVRESLGIGASDLVIGHTGRFCTPKNHGFLLEIAAEAARLRPDLKLLLIGDGPDRPAIEQRAGALGLSGRTIFAGARSDVPDLLQAMDVFLFPSLWEGLPLTVLEAQAAGLPCVISDVISEETDVVAGLVQRVKLAAPAAEWAQAVLAAASIRPRNRQAVLPAMENTSFNIQRSIEELYAIYRA